MSKIPVAAVEKLGANFAFCENGNHLISEGKVAILLTVNGSHRLDITNPDLVSEILIQTLHCDEQKLVKVKTISPCYQFDYVHLLLFTDAGFYLEYHFEYYLQLITLVSFNIFVLVVSCNETIHNTQVRIITR